MRVDLVDDDLEPQFMRPCEQAVKVRKTAEHRIHIAEIRHVVTEIPHGGTEERRNPDRIDAKVGDVGKAAKDWPQLNFVIYHGGYRHAAGGRSRHRTTLKLNHESRPLSSRQASRRPFAVQ